MLAQLEQKLVPFEEMLLHRPYLLEQRPRFVDFDLFGILGNFLYSGHYRLPAKHTRLRGWYGRMARVRHDEFEPETPRVKRAKRKK
jgi:glutathione S-transferase